MSVSSVILSIGSKVGYCDALQVSIFSGSLWKHCMVGSLAKQVINCRIVTLRAVDLPISHLISLNNQHYVAIQPLRGKFS